MPTLRRTDGAAGRLSVLQSPGAAASVSERTIRIITDSLRGAAPAAEIVRITVSEPDSLWLARAYGPDGAEITLPAALDEALARWVACDLPALDWRHQHDLEIASGRVAQAGDIAKAA
ncbi:hypothetical protein [Kitasatospora sp. NPDC001095]